MNDTEQAVLDIITYHPRYEEAVFEWWFPDSREKVAAAIESLIAQGRIERAKIGESSPIIRLVSRRERQERREAEHVAKLVDAGEAVLSADGLTVGPRACAECGERIASGVEVDGRFPTHPTCAELSTPTKDSGRGGWDADRWSGLDRTDEEIEALDVAPTSPECDFEVTWKPEALRQIREGIDR